MLTCYIAYAFNDLLFPMCAYMCQHVGVILCTCIEARRRHLCLLLFSTYFFDAASLLKLVTHGGFFLAMLEDGCRGVCGCLPCYMGAGTILLTRQQKLSHWSFLESISWTVSLDEPSFLDRIVFLLMSFRAWSQLVEAEGTIAWVPRYFS